VNLIFQPPRHSVMRTRNVDGVPIETRRILPVSSGRLRVSNPRRHRMHC